MPRSRAPRQSRRDADEAPARRRPGLYDRAVTYRDDHAAALTRAAALAQELEAERRRARAAEARATAAEDDRDRLAAENQRLRELVAPGLIDEPDVDDDELPDGPPPMPSTRDSTRWRMALLGALGVLGGIMVTTFTKTGPRLQPVRVQMPRCALRSSPPGAEVIGVDERGEHRLGRTPLALDPEGWWHVGRVELRLAGHELRIVDAPIDGGRCRDVVYPLDPIGARTTR